MIGAIWAVATAAAAPALRIMLRRRARHGREIAARLPEREGIEAAPRPPGRLVWLHAASLGEAQSVLPLIEALVASPGVTVLMTTGTVTSAAMLAGHLPRHGGRVLHRFVPLDVPAWAARFVRHWRPDVAGFVESELWPNLLEACVRHGVRLMLVNGRMSPRSFRGWRRVPGFAARVLGAFDTVHAQSTADAARLRDLGARRLEPPGNLKLAAPALAADLAGLQALRHQIGDRPVWLAASTHPGEEEAAASVHRRLEQAHPTLLTIVAPRHSERGPALAQALAAPRRAAGDGPPACGMWIADTMGELGLLYRLAPIVFVGRSLGAQRGGQNPLEPARLGCAVAVGPHTANFTDVVARLHDAGGLEVVETEGALAAWVDAMLRDPARRRAAGTAGEQAASGEFALPARLAGRLLALVA